MSSLAFASELTWTSGVGVGLGVDVYVDVYVDVDV